MIGKQASDLQASGLTWREVGEKLGITRQAARSAARRWRGTHGSRARGGAEITEEQVARSVEGANQETLTSKSARIKTLDQLLSECEVDLGEWRVERYQVNKWEVGAKTETGGISVEPLFQVKAWLTRHKLIPIFPTVQPVEVKATYAPPEIGGGDVKRSLVWCDPHFGFKKSLKDARLEPFHDRKALDLVLQIAEVARPDRIDILGDFLDLPEWTDRFLRSPEFYWTTQPTALEAHWWLAQLRQIAPEAVIKLHQGNHEKRLEDAVLRHLPAAYDLRGAAEMELPPALSVQRLLGLDGLGIEWVSDGDWLNDNVRLSHGERANGGPGDTAKATVLNSDTTEFFGHIHRIERASLTQWKKTGPVVISAICPGCTCRIDGIVPGKKTRQQWQQGAALVDYDQSDYNSTIIQINQGLAMWDRRTFKARDRVGDLHQDLPGWGWQ